MKRLSFTNIDFHCCVSFGQSSTDDFRKFANRQDELMMGAYQKRDTQKYVEALTKLY